VIRSTPRRGCPQNTREEVLVIPTAPPSRCSSRASWLARVALPPPRRLSWARSRALFYFELTKLFRRIVGERPRIHAEIHWPELILGP
jgi:hypothetical protein